MIPAFKKWILDTGIKVNKNCLTIWSKNANLTTIFFLISGKNGFILDYDNMEYMILGRARFAASRAFLDAGACFASQNTLAYNWGSLRL